MCRTPRDFDILIRNARVVDGTGNPWFRADVGVATGASPRSASCRQGTADRVIDAAGRVVAPGFIDVHTHIEGRSRRCPRGDNYILDGVTTIVTGNCGGSKLTWASGSRELEKLGLGLNVASLIGHNTVRREVMGTANRPATPEEIAKMQALVEQGMRDGAVGFSTGLIYIPGTYSNTARSGRAGKGGRRSTAASTPATCGTRARKVLEAIDEAVARGQGGRHAASSFRISRSITSGCGASSDKSLALVEKYRARRRRRGGRPVSVRSLAARTSASRCRAGRWRTAQEKIEERLKDPATRAKIVAEMERMTQDARPRRTTATPWWRGFEPDPHLSKARRSPRSTSCKGSPKNVRERDRDDSRNHGAGRRADGVSLDGR